jgi:hypothetical protein
MHVPSHSAALPDGVDPIPMPDTRGEAEMLLILLDAGLYPKLQPPEGPPPKEPEASNQSACLHTAPHRGWGRRPTYSAPPLLHSYSRSPNAMSENRCLCTTRQGDAYYCPIHGGNGSWAALLKATAQSLRHCWDPDIARQVEPARETLPDDHSLTKSVDSILSEENSRPN